jgi:pilus assembly protein CpaC
VELRDGQSFAIAGLIQSDFQDTVRQFPVLGDVPVLGALMRSSDFQNAQTELVIIVTPHLVRPAPGGSLVTPADNFVPPSDTDIWLFGRIEAPTSGQVSNTAAANSLAIRQAGGVDGSYGHIIK